MVGNTNLNQVNTRLNEIFGFTDSTIFGGIHVIFSGDLHQIPAVQQTMVFEPKGMAALGPNIWKDNVTFTELTEIVRTKGDGEFTELCHRLRVGEHTQQDVAPCRLDWHRAVSHHSWCSTVINDCWQVKP